MTGIPYAIVNNLNLSSSTRSFLDDPCAFHIGTKRFYTCTFTSLYRCTRTYASKCRYTRLEHRDQFNKDVRPSDAAVAAIDAVLRSENPLVAQLVNWSEETSATARLVLKWPGETTAVRAFSVDPFTSVKQPRIIFFTRRDEDVKCIVQPTSPEYAPLMWPLAFPRGEPMCLPSGMHLDAAAKSMQRATLAMLIQPERDMHGEYVLVPTQSPYGPRSEPVMRRFSRFELMGRLGDEFVLDRWLSVLDARLTFLSNKWAQHRIVGRFAGSFTLSLALREKRGIKSKRER